MPKEGTFNLYKMKFNLIMSKILIPFEIFERKNEIPIKNN